MAPQEAMCSLAASTMESTAQEPHQASHETNRVRKYLLNSVCAVICRSLLPVWPS